MMKNKTIMFLPALFFAVLILFALAPRTEAAGHIHDSVTFSAWNSSTSLPTQGSYYLNTNVTLTTPWQIKDSKTVNLCLNGHTITQTGNNVVIDIQNGSKLRLYDCQNTGAVQKGKGEAGIVVAGEFRMFGGYVRSNSTEYGGVLVMEGASFYLNGGTVCENEASKSGGGVYLQGVYSRLEISGGSIINNTSANWGGGVAISSTGILILNDGEISHNKALQEGGGGVCLIPNTEAGSFTMNGGIIEDNTAAGNGGGGVLVGVGGSMEMNGGVIRYNIAANGTDGGGILIQSSTEFYMNGGVISYNEARNGGGIYTLTGIGLSGGRIEYNKASSAGGGIYIKYGDIDLSGRVQVQFNQFSDDSTSLSNVCLNSTTSKFCAAGAIDGDAAILISFSYPITDDSQYPIAVGFRDTGKVSRPSSVLQFDQWHDYGCSGYTESDWVFAVTLPKTTSIPSDRTVANGKTTKFTVSTMGYNPSYQWEYSADNGNTWHNTTLSGCQTETLTFTASSGRNGYLFRAHIYNLALDSDIYTIPARLTVSGVKPAILVQPKAVTAASGKTVKFTVTAAGTSLKYQWQYSADNGSTWKNTSLSGYNTATLQFTASAARNGYQFRCIVSNGYGDMPSSGAKLTVSNVKPSILVQPKAFTIASGKTVKFTVAAAGSGLKYQWQYSANNGATWKNTTLSGCKTATLQFTASAGRNGYRFRCIVSNGYGDVTSSSAKLTVTNVKPAILVQPKAVTTTSGKTVKFTVTAAGSSLKYQWQYSMNNGSTWKNTTLSGYNTATLQFTATAARNGYLFRCIVSNSYGDSTSSGAKLTVE